MNLELSKKLLDDFPRLFRNTFNRKKLRFECGDGWFGLIYKLSRDIEAVAEASGLVPDSEEWPLCRQVKQKMGSLRFVVFREYERSTLYECISELRLDALNQSLQICEYCGRYAEFSQHLSATFCPECNGLMKCDTS